MLPTRGGLAFMAAMMLATELGSSRYLVRQVDIGGAGFGPAIGVVRIALVPL